MSVVPSNKDRAAAFYEWQKALLNTGQTALTRAAEYDRWVRGKVQASRDDPRPPVTDEEWQRIRAAKLVERKAAQAT